MSRTRYFEKVSGDVVRHWRISRDGIRCHMAWGLVGGRTQASSMTLDDTAHAERHFTKKISEKKRQGYVEVVPADTAEAAEPDAPADATLLDVMRTAAEKRRAGAWAGYWSGYEPVAGQDGVFAKFHDFPAGPGPFFDYLVLSGDERRGLHFVVKKPGHDADTVAAFLDFVRPRLELAFDGRSHHKVPLPSPIGRFDHVLFCAPSLNRDRYGGRLAEAFPIFDCEIGTEDTETVVEARLQGRDSMPYTTWDRAPFPVLDLTFDLRSENGFGELGGRPSVREKTFKVYGQKPLDRALRLLSEALPGSWLSIRNYRGDVLTRTRADLTTETPAEIHQFLLGAAIRP